jgi:DNA repair protein RadD
MILRPYQSAAIESLRAQLRSGKRRVLLVLPTGAGKTCVASSIIQGAVERGSQLLFLAHRRELIDQTSRKLDDLDVPHGVIMADHPRTRPYLPVQVASVQTLARRLTLSESNPDRPAVQPDLVFVDEAHHARAHSYQFVLDSFPKAVCIGLTATPWRTDGRGLGELFEEVVVGATVRELTELGFLVPARGFTYEIPDLSAVRTSAGDYNLLQLDEAMSRVVLGGDLVREWQEHAAGKRTVIFAVNVRHSKLLVGQFVAAGVPAEHVDDSTPAAKREAILRRIASGETLVVSNVGILTEGWDLPACEVAILARPTKSVALALQMMGRVLRPWCFDCADAPSETCRNAHRVKDHARLHDHAGVILEHGLPEQERDVSLATDRPKTAMPLRRCPECFLMVPLSEPVCPECGFEFERNRNQHEREVQATDGEKIDLDAMRAELDAVRSERARLGLPTVDSPRELVRVVRATPEEKAAEYLRLQCVAEQRGLKPGWVAHRYRETFGAWPNFTEDFLVNVFPRLSPFVRLRSTRQREVA